MRNGLLGSIAALATSAGLAFAQTPARISDVAASPPGRTTAMPMVGSAEPVPMGPSTLATPPTDASFYAAMQPQFPLGNEEPRLNAERANIQGDYLLWFIRSMPSAYPLVTASTTGPRGAVGPSTSVVFGAGDFQFNPISGGRYAVDLWWHKDPRFGFEFAGTILAQKVETFTAGFGTQMVARPVIDGNTGIATSLTIAAPGYATGGVEIQATDRFWAYESNGKFRFWCDETKEFSLICGFRYMDLAEKLDISQQSIFVPGVSTFFYGINFANPREIDVADTFQTRNQYYMAQLGLEGRLRYNRWSVQWTSKFAWGPVHETLVINGNSTLFLPAAPPATTSPPNTVPGGLLALSSNIGRFHRDEWAFMPEGGLQIGYRFFRSTDVVVGYQLTYLSHAMRPGDQVNPNISPNLIPTSQFFGAPGGVIQPTPPLKQSDFWVQGLNVGLQIHY